MSSWMAELHKIDPTAPIQSITRCTHATQIEMTDGPVEVLRNRCDQLIAREPSLLKRPSYRSRDNQSTTLPLLLWLDLVRYARECFDPAELDAQFLVAKLKEGLSSKEAFDALIASKRRKSYSVPKTSTGNGCATCWHTPLKASMAGERLVAQRRELILADRGK
ncbi:hypothetical protein [Pseudomonas protegens]|uniref:hypothetical protein n=1 Tax=Pseudomonas protegens TaxID=380021 RepID=UPI0022809BCC|nr:hypothetical protein [Pseudomonas protegens]MCY7261907.1 hypothetical protein [Pseudomonas protegens]